MEKIHIDIITLHPELIECTFTHSIMKRAQNKGLVEINLIKLRDFGLGKHKQVDDEQYGGGAGLVMMCEPLANCIEQLKNAKDYAEIIYLTPDGKKFNQKMANRLSISGNLLMVCGHYKGIDERIRTKYITLEISIGDFVLTGGELAAAVLVDSIVRLVPNVLNDSSSALTDSFQDDLLAPPVYTRPSEFDGLKVPEILLSGDFAKIEAWRYEQSIERTAKRRPDLLDEA